MSEPSAAAVRAAVAKLVPDATVNDVEPVEAGKNAVYAVSLDEREAILKVGTASPDRVRAEPEIMGVVRERTGIPVPAVLGASDDALERPWYLAERVPGRTTPDRPTDLPVAVLERLCVEAGRHLAELHDLDRFEGFGPLVPDEGDVRVADPDVGWPALLSRATAAKVEDLAERFDPLRDDLQAYADAVADDLAGRGPFASAFVHMDYRPANLVFTPEAATVTRGVLDWAGAAAAPPAYEVAHAEALLSDWPRLADAERTRLRKCFEAGYAEVRDLPAVPAAYRVDARLRLMKHLDVEVGDRDPAAVRDRADDHRRRLDAFGVP